MYVNSACGRSLLLLIEKLVERQFDKLQRLICSNQFNWFFWLWCKLHWNDSLNKTAYLQLTFNCVVDSQTFDLLFIHSNIFLIHALVLICDALALGLHVIAFWLPCISLLEWLKTSCLVLWEISLVESLGLIFGSFEKLFDVSSICLAQIFEVLLQCMAGILLLSIKSLA